jgi:hypothetical protein
LFILRVPPFGEARYLRIRIDPQQLNVSHDPWNASRPAGFAA